MRRRLLAIAVVVALIPIALAASRASAAACVAAQEIDLWNKGSAVLRGANVYQGRNVFNADVPFGDGVFSQSDFDDLKNAGANYVHISHAGLFSEQPPFGVDQAAVENLDRVLGMARSAGLYAGIAFRSGPGRNDLSIVDSTSPQANHNIWTSRAAQDAWVQMVRFAAERYRNDPIVVGLSVMVEPTAYSQHGFIDPEAFYQQYGGTIEDVNGLYARATAAIRSVDAATPILLEPEGHGNINWLPFLKVTGDRRTVYTPHDYAPFRFTHDGKGKYPSRKNNPTTLEQYLGIVDAFGQTHGVPVAITEFGARKIAKTAAKYIADRIAIQDAIGNWAIWTWQPAGFRDKFSVHNPGKIQNVLKAAWASNCTRAV
jgi:aryl-phospho-beta-D-glucosidase BglC (GH1 family)